MKSIQKNKNTPPTQYFRFPLIGGGLRGSFGFTLVELIVVISILAILGTIAFLSFGGFSSKARDGSRISDTVSLSKGLELYSVKSGYYPKPEGALTEGIINGTLVAYKGEIQDQISSLTKISKTPKDPLSNNYYIYGTTLDYKQYQIATTLENSLSFQENIGEKVYADGPTYQAKVIGNYRGLLKYSSGTTTYLSNIPSLIYNSGALLDNNTYYSIDKSTNLPYKIQNATNGNKKANEILLQLTGTAITLTGISLSGITTKDEILANSGTLKMLGYDLSAIEKIVIGSSSIVSQEETPIINKINGVCGTTSGQTLVDNSTIIGLGACTTGSLSGSVLGTGPWTWTCGGSDGGANMNCSAQKIIPPPDSYTKLLLHGEDFTDSSTLNNSLTLSGNVVINSAYKKFGNSSIYFDGTLDYITTPEILVGTGEDFTLETWIYKTAVDNDGFSNIFSTDIAGNIQFAVDWGGLSGKIVAYINGAVGDNIFGNAIVMNQWQHLAWVRTSGTIKTFVDGVYQGGGVNNNGFSINRIGMWGGGGYEFHGYLDEIRISKGIARRTSDFAVPTLPY